MIKFFRKFRQKTLSEGRTGKYLKYAIGEIVLVVIGILIALQINNWNEERKSIKNTELLLTQVQKELAFNITKTNKIISGYREKDSLVYKILHKEVTYADYKSNISYSYILLGQEPVEISNDAFLNLTNSQSNFIKEQDSIILNLKELYGTHKKRLDFTDKIAEQNTLEINNKYKNNHEWYYDYVMQDKTPDKMIEYYLTDPFYLNDVANFLVINLSNHCNNTITFRNNAIDIYKNLSDYLIIKKDTTIIKDIKDYTHYVGKYERNDDYTYEIKKQKDKVIFKWQNKTDSTNTGQANIYFDSKTYFTVSSLFGKFKYDENQNIAGFILSLGKAKLEYKKIKDF